MSSEAILNNTFYNRVVPADEPDIYCLDNAWLRTRLNVSGDIPK